jgi:hypothetical protein
MGLFREKEIYSQLSLSEEHLWPNLTYMQKSVENEGLDYD